MNHHLPRISVIMPCLNKADTIDAAIRSVCAQTYQNIECIVIDGGSTDETTGIVSAWQSQYPMIRLFSEKDRGVYHAMNKALGIFTGDWVYFLGADDLLLNENIFEELYTASVWDEPKVVYGNVQIRGQVTWAKESSLYDGPFDLAKLFRRNICHQAIFYPAGIIKQAGFFNENYPVTADWDYNIRCWAISPFRYYEKTIAIFNAGGVSVKPADDAFFDELPENVVRYFGIDPWLPKFNYPDSLLFYPVARYREKQHLQKIHDLEYQILKLQKEMEGMSNGK